MVIQLAEFAWCGLIIMILLIVNCKLAALYF